MTSAAENADRAAATTVLVVEDDAMLRQVVVRTLAREGFEVFEAGDGAEALEFLDSRASVDVVLTDVRMPRINGYQLAETLLTRQPDTPIMLMTGFTDEEMPEAIRAASIPVLRKPFNFALLGESLRELVRPH